LVLRPGWLDDRALADLALEDLARDDFRREDFAREDFARLAIRILPGQVNSDHMNCDLPRKRTKFALRLL
jgi:hypothetical protein